mmetsp:Transcript_83059/g.221937  ORF Transcript_83059/g.221937 Transcript_83059/m.221937 type:complete len:267 (-) Transcript_83059:529-1329(-)
MGHSATGLPWRHSHSRFGRSEMTVSRSSEDLRAFLPTSSLFSAGNPSSVSIFCNRLKERSSVLRCSSRGRWVVLSMRLKEKHRTSRLGTLSSAVRSNLRMFLPDKFKIFNSPSLVGHHAPSTRQNPGKALLATSAIASALSFSMVVTSSNTAGIDTAWSSASSSEQPGRGYASKESKTWARKGPKAPVLSSRWVWVSSMVVYSKVTTYSGTTRSSFQTHQIFWAGSSALRRKGVVHGSSDTGVGSSGSSIGCICIMEASCQISSES